jgi:hypothetical protein
MACNCGDLERENWRLKQLLRRHGIEDSAGDFDDDGEDYVTRFTKSRWR